MDPPHLSLGDLRGHEFQLAAGIAQGVYATFIWTAGAVVIVASAVRASDRPLFGRFLPVCIGALAVLATAYFIVRYLKKAKIVRPD